MCSAIALASDGRLVVAPASIRDWCELFVPARREENALTRVHLAGDVQTRLEGRCGMKVWVGSAAFFTTLVSPVPPAVRVGIVLAMGPLDLLRSPRLRVTPSDRFDL